MLIFILRLKGYSTLVLMIFLSITQNTKGMFFEFEGKVESRLRY